MITDLVCLVPSMAFQRGEKEATPVTRSRSQIPSFAPATASE
ncbi:MAG TPA: hypothetical protein VNA28_02245 [Solirubrobacteraceae bacterium]|nr:hypothetical protein [Solirubrobacteraceae bacterium]